MISVGNLSPRPDELFFVNKRFIFRSSFAARISNGDGTINIATRSSH